MPIQRMRAEDLLAAVFPAQLACGDNRPGRPIEPPDHPLVNETLANCLHEAMDIDGLQALLAAIEAGTLQTRAIDTAAPSPMSHEILNANPYAFLDDAPLEERRTRAVSLRRIDPDLAGRIGALDPAAVDTVCAQAWPDVRNADELHDVLLSLVLFPTALLAPQRLDAARGSQARARGLGDDVVAAPGVGRGEPDSRSSWAALAEQLIGDHRATIVRWLAGVALVAAERVHLARAALPNAQVVPPLPTLVVDPADPEDALRHTVRGWMECLGPVTVSALAQLLGIAERRIEAAVLQLEAAGVVLRGRFTDGPAQQSGAGARRSTSGFSTVDAPRPSTQWCDRRLLARIHRLTMGRLRREIESVSPADFLRYLLRWQHVHPGTQLHGRDGIAQVISQLQGLELPAPAWERDLLPCRVALYNPADLEQLCLAGVVAWGRLRLARATDESLMPMRGRRQAAPSRAVPLAFALREALPALLEVPPPEMDLLDDLSAGARAVLGFLQEHGAAFLSDIARASGRLPSQTEEALWELVARGLVTGDGIAGLRTLLLPDIKRRRSHRRLRGIRGGTAVRLMPVGRWALLRTEDAAALPTGSAGPCAEEFFAQQLLRRYGVVLRELLAREVRAPAWRALLRIYRRMEARGEIRGGRFVAGLVGEQFALPEAVDALRAVRRAIATDEVVCVSAADPLNLVGILTPGARVSPFSNQVIAYRNGVPVQIGARGAVRSALQAGNR